MRKPVVLSEQEVSSEAARLIAGLREARLTAKVSGRKVAAQAGIVQSSVWRFEVGRVVPRLWQIGRLAHALGRRLELDDGERRPRMPLEEKYLWPPGHGFWPSSRALKSPPEGAGWAVDRVRARIGAELTWARRWEFDPPLRDEAACELLGMSHHTLRAVESGPEWPYLTSVIRVAGLSGRRLALCDLDAHSRRPPWVELPGPPATGEVIM